VLAEGPGYRFPFYVISAGPAEVVRSALEVCPPDHVFGTEFEFDEKTGEIANVLHVPAVGQGGVLQELEARLKMSPDHTIYMGDGSSDLYVMQHVNSRDGHTIAVSESKSIGRIAHRTVLSDNALSVLVPILEDILKWDSSQIRELFASYGLALQDWDKIRTDWLTFHESRRMHLRGCSSPADGRSDSRSRSVARRARLSSGRVRAVLRQRRPLRQLGGPHPSRAGGTRPEHGELGLALLALGLGALVAMPLAVGRRCAWG